MFIGGICTNSVWLYTMFVQNNNVTSAGESSIIYVFWGACFVLFLIDSFIIIIGLLSQKLLKKKPLLIDQKSDSMKRRWVGGMFSIFLTIVLLADFFDGQTAFFSEYSHINYSVHIYGFVIGSFVGRNLLPVEFT